MADDRILLPLPIQPGVCLLIQFQSPVGITEPDQVMATGLKVQTIGAAGRRSEERRVGKECGS